VRILLAHSHANTLGGGERAVLEVGQRLAERHEVRLLLGGFDPRRTYPELGEMPHARLDRARWAMTRVDADAIVTNTFGANLLAFRNGSRVVYWVHTTRSRFLLADARRIDLRARRLLDWLAVRRAALVAANSRFTAGRVRDLYGREVDAVVYPGVDTDTFRPGESAASASAHAITVGRISPEKGLDRLFDAWRDLPDMPLHVVGDGSPEVVRELRALAPPGVIFRGALSRDDLARAYRLASLAVFAPRGEEFGLAPLEAMACGLPVVAWRDGGLQETVVDGTTGYLVTDAVTLRQRVRLLLHDPAQRAAFGSAARQRAAVFTWRRTADQIEALCQRLAARPG
jgi:glycosyltransferase involved in cell wall biosynthesis